MLMQVKKDKVGFHRIVESKNSFQVSFRIMSFSFRIYEKVGTSMSSIKSRLVYWIVPSLLILSSISIN